MSAHLLRVRCIDATGNASAWLAHGAEYEVRAAYGDYYDLDTGGGAGWLKSRFEPVPVQPAETAAESLRVTKGRARGEAVSAHLAAQANAMVRRWEAASNYGPVWAPLCAELQAGAAASRCMAECLDALMDGDVALFRATVEQFVNDAVTSGAVPLPLRA